MKNPKGRKVPMPKKSQKPEELLVFEIDRALTLLVDTCVNKSRTHGGEFVPIEWLQESKKILIDGYKKGLKLNPSFK